MKMEKDENVGLSANVFTTVIFIGHKGTPNQFEFEPDQIGNVSQISEGERAKKKSEFLWYQRMILTQW